MNTLDLSLMTSAACGVLMVGSSLLLLARGVIKLSASAREAGFTMELIDKIKITTGVPALALFLIGLMFVALAVFRAPSVQPFKVIGSTDRPYAGLSVLVADASEYPIPVAGMELRGVVRPSLDALSIIITAPGYVAEKRFLPLDHRGGEIHLDPVKLQRSDSSYTPPTDAQATPAPLPGAAPLSQPSFGRGTQP
jgi:hypothetical protein